MGFHIIMGKKFLKQNRNALRKCYKNNVFSHYNVKKH